VIGDGKEGKGIYKTASTRYASAETRFERILQFLVPPPRPQAQLQKTRKSNQQWFRGCQPFFAQSCLSPHGVFFPRSQGAPVALTLPQHLPFGHRGLSNRSGLWRQMAAKVAFAKRGDSPSNSTAKKKKKRLHCLLIDSDSHPHSLKIALCSVCLSTLLEFIAKRRGINGPYVIGLRVLRRNPMKAFADGAIRLPVVPQTAQNPKTTRMEAHRQIRIDARLSLRGGLS